MPKLERQDFGFSCSETLAVAKHFGSMIGVDAIPSLNRSLWRPSRRVEEI